MPRISTRGARVAMLVATSCACAATSRAQTITFSPEVSGWQASTFFSKPGVAPLGLLVRDANTVLVCGIDEEGTFWSVPFTPPGTGGAPAQIGTSAILPQYLSRLSNGCLITTDSNTVPSEIKVVTYLNPADPCYPGGQTLGGPQVLYAPLQWDCFDDADRNTGRVTITTPDETPPDCPAGKTLTGPYYASTDDLRGLVFDAFGNLFLIDNPPTPGREPDAARSGFITRIAGAADGTATAADRTDRLVSGLNNAIDIVFVPGGVNGTLYFSNTDKDLFPIGKGYIGKAELDAAGDIVSVNTRYFELPGSASAAGIAADSDGNVWIASAFGQTRLWRFTDGESPTLIHVATVNFDIRDIAVVGQTVLVSELDYSKVHALYPTFTCGDGLVESGEGCDDGNAVDGDCCSPTCQRAPAGSPCTDDGNCCTNDLCDGQTGCTHTANTTPPAFVAQPSLGPCARLWPPQHGYVDFKVTDTGAEATSACGISSIEFASCTSSQPENGIGVGDGNSTRDCVYESEALHLRAERDGACSPVGRVYTSSLVATDVCGNAVLSDSFEVGVWHDRGHPPDGPYYSANPGSNQNDTRNGISDPLSYGTGCGAGSACVNGQGHDASDADPEMEIYQNASISVDDLRIEKATGGTVRLTWTEPAHSSGIHVTRFHVYRLDPVTLFWTQLAEVAKQTTSYLDLGSNDGNSWQYKVAAVIK